MDFGQQLLTLGSWVGSVMVIVGAATKFLEFAILKPYEKRRNAFEKKLLDAQKEGQKPLSDAINQLNVWLAESKRSYEHLRADTNENSRIVVIHDGRLDDHEVRITVLENLRLVENNYKKERGSKE